MARFAPTVATTAATATTFPSGHRRRAREAAWLSASDRCQKHRAQAADPTPMARADSPSPSVDGPSIALLGGDQPVVPVIAAVDDVAALGRDVGKEHERLAVGIQALDGLARRQLGNGVVGDAER